VKPLVITLRERPNQRLDLSQLVPHLLAGKTASDIEHVALQTTRRPLNVGEIFHVRMGSPEQIRIEGACERFDHVGQSMASGEIFVDGHVGIQAGRLMTGGRLTISGNVGPWAASAMRGGVLEILGEAGDRLGGPLAGEMAGMRGGVVVVRGRAGDRVGDRMRRGTIVIEGRTGAYAGSRMIAGTLMVVQKAASLPGFLMKRGTIILGEGCSEMSPTFLDCGQHQLLAMKLWSEFIDPYSKPAAALLKKPLRRLAGDAAVLGKGEIFVGNGN
jgi:formylmethanofuran dehydrogenase subunit C